MDFVERLPGDDHDVQRWLVRTRPDAPLSVAWIVADSDAAWMRAMEGDGETWIGFDHPRVVRVRGKQWLKAQTLAFLSDDDRGPAFADAACVLADAPDDRERWAVAQMITVADALGAMARHAPPFVHGQIAPGRMFVDHTGRARLRAPIGLQRAARPARTGQGRMTGTASFLSPEQCRGLPLTPASDVFSLASNLALALTGAPPFGEITDNPIDLIRAILQEPAAPIPTRAAGLDRVLARAFAKTPADRYPDPAAFGAALYDCVPDAGDYDAVISDRISAWWPTAPQASGPSGALTGMRCRMAWEQLESTGNSAVRHCKSCNQSVVRVTSFADAVVPLAGNTCFSYQPPEAGS